MSELKCPFCNQKLEPIGTSGQFQCGTWGCDASFNFIATRDVWEYIDRTRKELEQSETCCSEWEKQALDYKAELIKTEHALDRVVWWLNEIVESHRCTPISTAEKALAEINQIMENKGE